MKELKYIRKVAEAFPYEYEQPPICKVELWDFSRANENDEARKEAVCLVASISYGNEYCKDPEKLWNLLIERGHESPFEFVRQYGSYKGETKDWNLREIDFPTDDVDDDNYDGAFSTCSVNKRVFATFKLKVPIFVARQIQRHRSFSYMEMSRRYVKGDKVEFEFWKNKAMRNVTVRDGIDTFSYIDLEFIAKCIYVVAVIDGIKPEQARAFLPLGLYTQFWMQGDYKAWLNFFIHRLHPEAQEETRLVAQAMWNLLKEHQPEIIGTMANYLEEWTKDCNPMFTPARERKAEWFKENFLRV